MGYRMKLSLFTPTHNTQYLQDAYASIRMQNYENWEWVILPNGASTKVPENIAADPKVKVVEGKRNLHNIGALKRAACDAASGDAFVELDHDDMLAPAYSLRAIADAFKRNNAGFVFSDAAVFRYKRKSPYYSAFSYSGQHGWENYDVDIYGRSLKATRAFKVSPRSLCEIYYSPDHVRCWSRKAYYTAGGHNPSLSVADDHELMVKTYLAGFNFEHTGGCHYLYRMFDRNTVIARNKEIQKQTRKIKQESLPKLIREWASRKPAGTLDLSELKASGWTADKHLEQGLGVDQYAAIVADSELQKMTGEQVREFMNFAYEGLIAGGYLSIVVPEVHSGMGYGDVEWKSHFSATSMGPYTRKNMAKANGNIRCRFQQVALTEVYPSDWHRDNGFKYLRFDLAALKGQRHPGIQHI
jgi:glycosyltransferase involved in cell wall biosynthesis